ncbi:MAG: ABC transporter permease [Candidatus Paceibacterota bacterium]
MTSAIYIMWLRQIKKYFRSKSRIIGSLGQPLLFFVALGFGFKNIYAAAGEGNYLNFLAPGIIAMTVLFSAIFSGIEIIWERQFGFLKETLVAPVSRTKIMIGKTLGGATTSIFQATLLFAILILFGFEPNWVGLPLAVIFIFLIAIFFSALGIAIASRMSDMQGFQLIMNFLVMPIFFLSGALFPLSDLPPAITFITKIDPLTYGVDGLRGALSTSSSMSVGSDFLILSVLCVFITALGSYSFSKTQI